MNKTITIPTALKIRCAVYTRKSSEEGLEMEFNSLDAQREACEAYIVSQKPEGWVLVSDHYDDGGWSGGTLANAAGPCWGPSRRSASSCPSPVVTWS